MLRAVDGSAFRPWAEASGQWITDAVVEPIEVERFDDLLGHRVKADIELRAVPNLWPLRDLAVEGPWDFSVVRFQQAKARPPEPRRPSCLIRRSQPAGCGSADEVIRRQWVVRDVAMPAACAAAARS